MKIFYIAGFLAPTQDDIQRSAKSYLDEGSVVWIPQRKDKNNQFDLNLLKSDILNKAVSGATEILICCFIFRQDEHILGSLNAIKTWAVARHPGLNITIERFKNARDAASILTRIDEFGPSRKIALPDTLASVDVWAEQHCHQRIFLHPRAVRGAKESQYFDVELAYAALWLLAKEYWELRTATPARREQCQRALKNKLESLGLELAPSISDTRAGEQGDDYKIVYPFGGSSKSTLELHLKKGVDRDQRNCLRIYFFWDSERHITVIGWMTSHLGTRAS